MMCKIAYLLGVLGKLEGGGTKCWFVEQSQNIDAL